MSQNKVKNVRNTSMLTQVQNFAMNFICWLSKYSKNMECMLHFYEITFVFGPSITFGRLYKYPSLATKYDICITMFYIEMHFIDMATNLICRSIGKTYNLTSSLNDYMIYKPDLIWYNKNE